VIDKELYLSDICYIKIIVLAQGFWAFTQGSGGNRELQDADRKHFLISWYLSVAVVTSYGQKPWDAKVRCVNPVCRFAMSSGLGQGHCAQ